MQTMWRRLSRQVGGARGRPPAAGLMLAAAAVLAVAGTLTVRAVGTPAGTVIRNQAYADYQDANGNALPRVYSEWVETTVSQVAGVDVTPETASKSGAQGTSVTFGATITNTGNGPDTFALTAVNADGWTATIYLDANGNGVLDPGETTVASTGSLPADGSYKVIVKVDVPAGTANNTQSATTLTAVSGFDGSVQDAGTYTVVVLDAVLTITKTVAEATGYKPGDEVVYAIEGHNTGSAPADNVVVTDQIPVKTTYVPGSIRIGPVGGTYAAAAPKNDGVGDDGPGPDPDYGVRNPGKITVVWGTANPEPDPSGSGVIYFKVRINSGVAAGTTIRNTADINYDVGGNAQPQMQSTTPTFNVAILAGLYLGPDRAQNADPGDTVTYAFDLTNNGNAPDNFDFSSTSTLGLTWVLWADVNGDGIAGNDGDYKLTDTDGDGRIESGEIASGSTLHILAVATVPAGTADGSIDSTVFTATSNNDPTKSDPVTLTTTVTAPRLSIEKSVSPAGNQPPGTELTYTITVTNTGTGVATHVVVSDLIPQYTTYKPGSIWTGSDLGSLVNRTDAADGDGAMYDTGSNAVVTDPGPLGPGGVRIVRFTVTIQ